MSLPATFTEVDLLHDSKKGQFPAGTCHWEGPYEFGEYTMAFVCPCGCGEHDFVIAAPAGAAEGRRAWAWDGNLAKPTLSPSIYRVGAPCKWHGFLRAGIWVNA